MNYLLRNWKGVGLALAFIACLAVPGFLTTPARAASRLGAIRAIKAGQAQYTGTIGANGQYVYLYLNPSFGAAAFGIQGTHSITLVVQEAMEDQLASANWITVSNTVTTNDATQATGAIGVTSIGIWTSPVHGHWIRMYASGYTSGAAVVSIQPYAAGSSGGSGGGGGGGAVTAAAGSYSSGAFSVGAGTDGWDSTEGLTTDAAVGDATGTISAHIRYADATLASILTGQNNTLSAQVLDGTVKTGLAVVNAPNDTRATNTITVVDSGTTVTGKYRSGAATVGSTYAVATNGSPTVTFEVAGSGYTVVAEATNDTNATAANIRWETPLYVSDNRGSALVNSISADGTYTVNCAGMTQVRLICTAFTSNITIYSVRSVAPNPLVQLVGPANPAPTTAGGITTQYVNGALSSTAIAVKASAGNVYDVTCGNPDATDTLTVEIFNTAAGSVSVGTTVPIWFISLGPGQRQNFSFMLPRTCGTAISVVAVKGFVLTGSTAPTTAANVCIGYN